MLHSLFRNISVLSLLLGSGFASGEEIRSFHDKPDLPTSEIKSGYEFLTRESRALQSDDFANPGLLWVDRGEILFHEEGEHKSCASCHKGQGNYTLAGAAATFPKMVSGRLTNLEVQINHCRVERQRLVAFEYESEKQLSLTAYVASLSRGIPYQVSIAGDARSSFTRGRDYFFQRRGQLNLACTQCHDDNQGKLLRGDRISQGHPNAYPGYRLEWQTFGSLHRRIQDCDVGVKAAPFEAGSTTYIELELYLAWRAKHLLLESPGIRR